MKPQTLREMREQAGLLQDELATRLGITKGTISKIENGRQGISLEMTTRWCAICGRALTSIGPEHEALLREVAQLSDEEAVIARRLVRLLPTLHPLRQLDLTNQLVNWSQVSGSASDDVVKKKSMG